MATTTTDTTASADPALITRRGPRRSMCRPTKIPTPAATTRLSENAPVSAVVLQPVSLAIEDKQDREGVVQHAPAGDLRERQDPDDATQPGVVEDAGLSRWLGVGHSFERPPMVISSGAAVTPQQPAELADSSSSNSPAPPQTPVSGSVSSTRSAASWSPAIAATTERTCSKPVMARKDGGAAVALHADHVEAGVGLGQFLGAVRIDGAAGVHVGVDQRGEHTR